MEKDVIWDALPLNVIAVCLLLELFLPYDCLSNLKRENLHESSSSNAFIFSENTIS